MDKICCDASSVLQALPFRSTPPFMYPSGQLTLRQKDSTSKTRHTMSLKPSPAAEATTTTKISEYIMLQLFPCFTTNVYIDSFPLQVLTKVTSTLHSQPQTAKASSPKPHAGTSQKLQSSSTLYSPIKTDNTPFHSTTPLPTTSKYTKTGYTPRNLPAQKLSYSAPGPKAPTQLSSIYTLSAKSYRT